MISREIQTVPMGGREQQVFLRKTLRDHYQDIRDIYMGEAVLEDVTRFDVRFYGADPTGATDSTAAFVACAAAIASAGSGVMYIPPGTYIVSSEILIITDGTWIIGAGQKVTNIYFNPTAAGTLFNFKDSGSTIVNCGIRNLSILSSNTTDKKTAIAVEDGDYFDMRNISVLSWTSTSNDSVGLQTNGRDLFNVSDIIINADIPIQISANPNETTIDLDASHFHNLSLIASSTNPCVKVTNDCQLMNVTFDGYQAWALGGYGFYWLEGGTGATSLNLSFKNVRWEQSTNSTGYIFYIDNDAVLYNCILENCYGGVGNNHKGYYFRNVVSLTMRNVYYTGTAEALNIDETCRPVSLENVFFQVGSTISVGNLKKVYDSSRMDDIAGSISPFVLYNQVQYPTRYPTFGVPINVAGINIVTNDGLAMTNDGKVLTNS